VRKEEKEEKAHREIQNRWSKGAGSKTGLCSPQNRNLFCGDVCPSNGRHGHHASVAPFATVVDMSNVAKVERSKGSHHHAFTGVTVKGW
jgi:hypothetical protein